MSLFNIFLLFSHLVAAGADGVRKVVENFLVYYPSYPKRQVEIRIYEIAVKEKRGQDSNKVMPLNVYQCYIIYAICYMLCSICCMLYDLNSL